MPMTTREANKTKRPALVVIQARSPKQTRRKGTSQKQKEAPPETGIEHISEIETRQAEIHTDASNVTPATTTCATRPRPRTATVVTQKKGMHASKSRNGPKNNSVSLAKGKCYIPLVPVHHETHTHCSRFQCGREFGWQRT